MPSQIEARIGKLEQHLGVGAAGVVILFNGDDCPSPEGATVIKVRFIEPGVRDAQEAS